MKRPILIVLSSFISYNSGIMEQPPLSFGKIRAGDEPFS